MDLILTGRPVPADEALAMGLVNRIVPAGSALEAARQLASDLAALPPECMRRDRLSVLDQRGLDEPAALANEFAHGQASLRHVAAGIAAFQGGQGRHGAALP
jgi:enoyl-CoA hydratase